MLYLYHEEQEKHFPQGKLDINNLESVYPPSQHFDHKCSYLVHACPAQLKYIDIHLY